ncbi:uncharacterized protein N7469_003245 [Penicillium citrinum]|uniref:Methyltransferase domain-containing protein n=1 Tax=Penicillium citrinum TaxID=5077 RepID=A0A9W9PBU0_PENCI|nr:uncharacterized protein N7469_003245 [Penicillium citrinum]KAJ5241654.1 hypothetical protein N7469_003245 [Penicillium citrinum]
MASKTESVTYTHGHDASVIRNHSARTAKNSVAFLLPHSTPGMKFLDIGSGPGSITVDLAEYVPQGQVIGLELMGSTLDQRESQPFQWGIKNIEFVEGDANGLAFEDGDPIGMLKETNWVTKSGGIVAAREADYGVFVWYPELPGLTVWQGLYEKTCEV